MMKADVSYSVRPAFASLFDASVFDLATRLVGSLELISTGRTRATPPRVRHLTSSFRSQITFDKRSRSEDR